MSFNYFSEIICSFERFFQIERPHSHSGYEIVIWLLLLKFDLIVCIPMKDLCEKGIILKLFQRKYRWTWIWWTTVRQIFCIWRTICLVPVWCISSIRHMYTTDFANDGPIFLVPLSPSYPSSPVAFQEVKLTLTLVGGRPRSKARDSVVRTVTCSTVFARLSALS